MTTDQPLDGVAVHLSGGDGGALVAALGARGARLEDGDGPVDAVIHIVATGGAGTETAISETSPAEWTTRCDVPLAAAIDAAQDAHRRLSHRGGRLIFVVPSLGLTGAPGLVPLATASEGVRALAKSAARQWGADGITVACVAHHVGGPTVALPSLGPPDLDDLAGVVALLLDSAAAPITGTTVVVDGGTVLVP